jgi:outer membrane receptor protein involved in Fe transport
LHADARWLSPHYEGPVYATQLAPGAAFGNAWVKTQGEYVEDVSASWQLRKFSLTGYMRNIGNNRYKTNVIANPAFGQVTATPYNPRTMGIIGSVGW